MNIFKFKAYNKDLKKFLNSSNNNVKYLKSYSDCVDGSDNGAASFTVLAEDLLYFPCTGVLDKNAKEIYQGDLVKYEYGSNGQHEIFQVVWDDFGAGFSFAGKDGKSLNHTGFSFINNIWHGNDNYEIIGNIMENPELVNNLE